MVEEMNRSSTLDFSSFSQRFREESEKITGPYQASLAHYMLYRRNIINIYRQLLRKPGNRFEREAAIHRLIFPMGKDLDTSKVFMEHNLWLVDDRLTFAEYIASDMALSEHKVLFEVEDRCEPDIVAYFPLTFSNEDPSVGWLRSVLIVEFKRPGDLQSRDENPWEQVMRYITKMRKGFYNADGQKIKAHESTRFYCYIICDTDKPKVKEFLDVAQFEPLFNSEEGYFLYHKPFRAYVEVLPFKKLLADAERSHRAFFARLGMLNGS